jgi:hypothetical protein
MKVPHANKPVNVSLTESGERYEAIVKHYLEGVLHIVSFETLDQARAYLVYCWCWAKLPVERHYVQIDCGAAIYDKHDSRKRILTLGADYLVNENGNKDA